MESVGVWAPSRADREPFENVNSLDLYNCETHLKIFDELVLPRSVLFPGRLDEQSARRSVTLVCPTTHDPRPQLADRAVSTKGAPWGPRTTSVVGTIFPVTPPTHERGRPRRTFGPSYKNTLTTNTCCGSGTDVVSP